jgi:phage terminase Nu1 subunit (DNA packaging protein)
MAFRSDEEAARIRANELESELESARATTAATLAELASVRAERQSLEQTTREASRIRWHQTKAFSYVLVGLIGMSGLALLFSIMYFPRVMLEGRW